MSKKHNAEQAAIDEHWRLLPQYEAELRTLKNDPALVPNRLKGARVTAEGDAV